MRSFIRKFAVAAALALAAGGVTVATAGSASASGWGCSGTEVATYPVQLGNGTVYSYVHLFWDSSTGYNCAVNVKVGSMYGTLGETRVAISECTGDTPGTCGSTVNEQVQDANFYYYAGPVRVYGQGHCITLDASTWNYDAEATYSGGPYHC
ncbi:hypothetical protein E6W39_28270 [Kitasatospora acidiphila]|uniref:Spore-associated protein A n=1 Tax=Kitasatospora acidiphila TaxID=2567942 RepID=A0A540W8R4_9ACTN|nr:hypothetical protein [Kitasatospora acidiphila]TQF05419.1 hypothetical protein E6W39_28270 [Kitasatospora acidiphila]